MKETVSTDLYCKCGQAITITHFTDGYLLECIRCGSQSYKGWRGFLGSLFGGGFYGFLCTGRWPRYVKE